MQDAEKTANLEVQVSSSPTSSWSSELNCRPKMESTRYSDSGLERSEAMVSPAAFKAHTAAQKAEEVKFAGVKSEKAYKNKMEALAKRFSI